MSRPRLTVREVINRLSEYDPLARFQVLVDGYPQGFAFYCSGSEGCTKATAEIAGVEVGDATSEREWPGDLDQGSEVHGDALAMEVISWAATALLTNQPGWMDVLAKRINLYLESVGDVSRLHFDGERIRKT